MELKDNVVKTLVKKGRVERADGSRVWDISDRGLLYIGPELAEAFLKLRAHPRYKATIIDLEISLLKKVAPKFLEIVGDKPCNLIDMGCGDGKKAEAFIESLNGKGNIRYCPVNINKGLVDLALKNLKEKNFPNVSDYKPILANLKSLYDAILLAKNPKYQKNVVLLLGSIIAGFDIHEYLFELSNSMNQGDCLLVGNAIRTGERFANIENYKHPLFKEWLGHLIKQLNFGDEEVEYGARFENGRVECFYKIGSDKKFQYEGKEFDFKRGDDVVVAVLYKYYADELEKFCKMYFREVMLMRDENEEQALVCCIK
jgi:uncharacterized SAM-dependent methyltransferase